MDPTIFSGAASRRASRQSRLFHPHLRGLLGLGILTCSVVAQAQSKDTDAIDIPWMPDVIAAIDAYVPAPSFNHGHFYLDHFNGPVGAFVADEVGVVTAPMANGDTVVAGLVPPYGGTGSCSNGTTPCSIGLVRYNSLGVRVAWTSPGAYGHNSNQYVIYPSGDFGYQYIRDIKIANGEIYVMVDAGFDGGGGKDVQIVVFDPDGAPLFEGLRVVFGFGSGSDNEDFYGAQMVMFNNYMMVTATAYDFIGPFIVANRLTIEPDHSLSQDSNWGDGYGGGTVNRLTRYYAPDDLCNSEDCNATAGYAAKPAGSDFADFYVGGSVNYSGNDWDVVTLKISSQDGALKTEFGGGWVATQFDETNSTKKDLAGGLYVYQDEVYAAAQVARKCHDGIGLVKLNGATGGAVTAFGGTGKVVFGGQGNVPTCILESETSVPTAISATGGRIGIAGYQALSAVGGDVRVDPMLAVVDAVNGSVMSFGAYPLTRTDGSRFGDAVLYGIYGGALPTSPFTVSGNGRDQSAGNSLSYVTGRFIPVSGDRIFASGFGVGDEH